jgi:hypothetical protein
MAITYLPLVGANLLNAVVGGATAGTVIAPAAVPGVAAAGRPGSLKFSALFLFDDADGVDDDNPVIATLEIPPGILAIPSTLAAISANAPYDYTQMLPVVTAQSLGVVAAFPTTLVDGSFLFVGTAADILTRAGVVGVNPPNPAAAGVLPAAANNSYGSVDVSLAYAVSTGGTLPGTLMLQLTVDWSASISN